MSVHICFRLTKLRPYIGTNIFRTNDTDQIRKTYKIVGILMRRRLKHKKKRCRSRPGRPKLVSWPRQSFGRMHCSPPTRRRPSRQRDSEGSGSSLDWLLGYHKTNRPRYFECSGLGSGSGSGSGFGWDHQSCISLFAGGSELQGPTC